MRKSQGIWLKLGALAISVCNKHQMINERLLHGGVWGQDYPLPLMLSFEEHQSFQKAEQTIIWLRCLICDPVMWEVKPDHVSSSLYFSWRNSALTSISAAVWITHWHTGAGVWWAGNGCQSVNRPYTASPTLSQLLERRCSSSPSALISAPISFAFNPLLHNTAFS